MGDDSEGGIPGLKPARADVRLRTSRGSQVAGVATVRDAEASDPADLPLLVCLHGGGYTGSYFDVPGFSLLDTADANGFDAVSLDRPGYGGSDAPDPGHGSFAANAEMLDDAIGALWAERGDGHPGIVIISHSIGSAIAVHLAARHPAWPLLGVALHGINVVPPDAVTGIWHSMPPGLPVTFGAAERRQFLYGPDGTFSPDAIEAAAISAAPAPLEELIEVVGTWCSLAADLAAEVEVPVHYVLAEHDTLWVVDQGSVDAFARMFSSAPFVDASLALGVGHNIDHHHLGRALHLRQLAFALTCVPVPRDA